MLECRMEYDIAGVVFYHSSAGFHIASIIRVGYFSEKWDLHIGKFVFCVSVRGSLSSPK